MCSKQMGKAAAAMRFEAKSDVVIHADGRHRRRAVGRNDDAKPVRQRRAFNWDLQTFQRVSPLWDLICRSLPRQAHAPLFLVWPAAGQRARTPPSGSAPCRRRQTPVENPQTRARDVPPSRNRRDWIGPVQAARAPRRFALSSVCRASGSSARVACRRVNPSAIRMRVAASIEARENAATKAPAAW